MLYSRPREYGSYGNARDSTVRTQLPFALLLQSITAITKHVKNTFVTKLSRKLVDGRKEAARFSREYLFFLLSVSFLDVYIVYYILINQY